MTEIEQELWKGVYIATIGLLLADDNSLSAAQAAYIANSAVDQFRAAAPTKTTS